MEPSTTALIERLARLLQNDSHAAGLKPAQWEVLRFLTRANRFSRNPGSVTSYLGSTKGTVSQTLKALEAKGLIKKAAHKTDKRIVLLDLTKNGRQILRDDPMSEIEKTIQKLPADDRRAMSATIEKLVKLMLSERTNHMFGICNSCRYFARNHESGAPHFCKLLNEILSDEDSKQICVEQSDMA